MASSVLLLLFVAVVTSVSSVKDIFHMEQNQFTGKDQTSEVFGADDMEIFPVAYVDLNGDKLTDIVAISRDRTALDIFLAFHDPPYIRRALDSSNITDENGDKRIVSVRPTDFTGDGRVDLMITLRKEILTYEDYDPGNGTAVEILFCSVKFESTEVILECPGPGKGGVLEGVVQEPMVLDVNGDMVMDLIGEVWKEENGSWSKQRTVWYYGNMGEYFEWLQENFTLFENPDLGHFIRDMINVSCNAYADLDGDDVPELIVISEDPKTVSRSKAYYFIETFDIVKGANEKAKFRFKSPPQVLDIKYPINSTMVLGQPIVVDFERSGNLEFLLPHCWDFDCKNFGIHVVDREGIATPLPLESFRYDGMNWGFIPPEAPPKPPHRKLTTITPERTTSASTPESKNLTITKPHPQPPEFFKMELFYSRALALRVGDFNLDGYQDLLVVLKTIHTPAQYRLTRPVVLENIPCDSKKETHCLYNRTFSPNFEMFKDYKNVISASFYDIKDNGALDVFLVKHHQNDPSSAGQKQKFIIQAFENEMNFDSSFLKFMVLTGRDGATIPYGNILPGAKIRYSSVNGKNVVESGVMAQTYSTSHMPMDLPCGVFGIGHSPNFIESFSVSVAPNAEEKYRREWLQIIPNSQVVVVPSPVDRPNRWTMKLFLTPSDAVLNTFGVLVGLCAVLATFVAALEFKERREDRKARQCEASRLFM